MKQEQCSGCVYYPPNLPKDQYSEEDWELVRNKNCSYDASPGDSMCNSMRRNSCRLVSLK